jgi:signal transduction histidine kinase/CheY-like chemotaxis protein
MVEVNASNGIPAASWWSQLVARSSPRAAGWAASIGLCVVLLFLTGFSVWVAFATNQAATSTKNASQLSDKYEQARYAVGAEESLERKYRLEPSAEVRAKHRAAAADLLSALTYVRQFGGESDRAIVDSMITSHRRYLDAVDQMFIAVDAGDAQRVREIDEKETDPAFTLIEEQVDRSANDHHEQAIQRLADLEQTEHLVFITTPIVFAIGILLLVLFWFVLRSYQKYIDEADKQATQRELDRIKSVVARDAAEAANLAKSSFLATMSHELRTPLSAIIGYTELLQLQAQRFKHDNLLPDIAKIWTSGKHLLALINDVLDLSKIEAGKMELYLEPIDMNSLLDEIVSSARPLVEKNDNKFVIQQINELGILHSDSTKVRQILLNLLSNAAKFTDAGTITLEVERKHDQAGDQFCFRVMDTGIGIAADQLDRLFQAFTQADATTTRKYGGTGLGLVLSRRLSELLGGAISVESTLGVGSCFEFSLPATQAGQTAPSIESRLDIHVPENQPNSMTDALGTVLVIDDDPAAREVITRYLVSHGLHVETASTGAEGIRRARELQPIAITLDVVMREMDGWEVLTTLKADPAVSHIPVIMLTIVDEQRKGFALGVTDYLVKPVDSMHLAALLSRYQQASNTGLALPHGQILLVEDDPQLRAMLARLLSDAGWVVAEADTGPAALECATTHQPDMIILDLMLPGLDGIQVIDALRATPAGQDVPIVVITAKDLTAAERNHLNSSVAHILQKGDYRLDDLLGTVYELMLSHLQNQYQEHPEAAHD